MPPSSGQTVFAVLSWLVAPPRSPPLRSDRGNPDPRTSFGALARVVSSSENRARIRLVASPTITLRTHSARRPSNQSWCEPFSGTVAPKHGLRSRHGRCGCFRQRAVSFPPRQQPSPHRVVIHLDPLLRQLLGQQGRTEVCVAFQGMTHQHQRPQPVDQSGIPFLLIPPPETLGLPIPQPPVLSPAPGSVPYA